MPGQASCWPAHTDAVSDGSAYVDHDEFGVGEERCNDCDELTQHCVCCSRCPDCGALIDSDVPA